MTTLIDRDPWATLPADWRTPKPPPPPTYEPRWPIDPDKLPQATCNPRCRNCRHPEGRGLCRTCVIICDHTVQRTKRKLVDVCLVRTTATARLVTSPSTGRQLLVVDRCPTCGRPHIHAAEPTLGPYRVPPACRQPYLLDLP